MSCVTERSALQNKGIHTFQQKRLYQVRITRSLEFDKHQVL